MVDKETLRKWAEMTDNNDHCEVVAQICDWAADRLQPWEAYFNTVSDFCREIRKADSLKMADVELRTNLTAAALAVIRRFFGEEAYKEIKDCL